MAGARNHRNPTFLWQAILILLPILVLAAFGAVFLYQDKALTLRDAADRAQSIAEELASQMWNEISATNLDRQQRFEFAVDEAGQSIFPPSLEPVPVPRPFRLGRLDPGQQQLWRTIQTAELRPPGIAAAVRACQDFLDSRPPAEFAAGAQYALGLFLFQQREYEKSENAFSTLLQQYPDAMGESGILIRPLAELKLLQLAAQKPVSAPGMISVDELFSNAVCHPDALSPEILQQAGRLLPAAGSSGARSGNQVDWQRRWWHQQTVRELYLSARPFLHTHSPLSLLPPASIDAKELEPAGSGFPRMFWFSTPELPDETGISSRDWLAVRTGATNTGYWFTCHNEAGLGLRLFQLARENKQIPDYFGLGLEICGKRVNGLVFDQRVWSHVSWFSPKSPGGGVRKVYSDTLATNILASAVQPGHGMELLKVRILLTSPTALFEHQQARAFWFGTLILASILAALIGLLAAWRAFKRQQQLTELKSNFVSSVSHELRAPIASVRLMAESLELGKVTEPLKQNEYFHFMVQECRRLSSLIENVLDFSRIEQGRKQYEFEPTDLSALTRATVKLMESYAAEKEVQLRFESSNPEGGTAGQEWNVDGRAIQQALVNLIDNAIKHSPKGATVEVGLTVQSPGAGLPDAAPLNPQPSTLNLSIRDYGPGIPREEYEKIFERFYRRGSELRRETQGVGIGLSLVKHIVEAHGGRVQVESEVGKGSRFTIQLGARDETPDAER